MEETAEKTKATLEQLKGYQDVISKMFDDKPME